MFFLARSVCPAIVAQSKGKSFQAISCSSLSFEGMDFKELTVAAKLGLSGLSTSNALPSARSGIPLVFVVIRDHQLACACKSALYAGS